MEYGWWLTSRAAGVLALVCVAVSVGIGLAMAGRVSGRPRLARQLMACHQQTALAGLVAVAVHGIALMGDRYLDPGVQGIAVPFVLDHARLWTGLGVVAGWLAAILGLTYWLRDRIGPQRWRTLHRATLLVYVLSVAHTLGSGTNASQGWLQLLVVATAAPILFLFVVRVLPAPAPVTPGFRPLKVARVVPESATVTSFWLEPADGTPLPAARPGQSVAVKTRAGVRSYSLSKIEQRAWRISVKREDAGAVSRHLHAEIGAGDVLEVGDPAGTFVLDRSGAGPVGLVSAGVGATPLLAMLDALAREGSTRETVWIHTARSPAEHAFRLEALDLVQRLPRGRHHVHYSAEHGRLAAGDLALPADADVYVCGPTAFADALRDGLGIAPERFHSESFGGGPAPKRPAVAFARSGVTVDWDDRFANLLELAEANDVPAPSSCRVGACQTCRATLTAGSVEHDAGTAAPPSATALLCCARPAEDVVLDL
jgi:ferredoxin-NADP reductase/DMSO/TMAO reductase YedYZ heme-binding membrane subunit